MSPFLAILCMLLAISSQPSFARVKPDPTPVDPDAVKGQVSVFILNNGVPIVEFDNTQRTAEYADSLASTRGFKGAAGQVYAGCQSVENYNYEQALPSLDANHVCLITSSDELSVQRASIKFNNPYEAKLFESAIKNQTQKIGLIYERGRYVSTSYSTIDGRTLNPDTIRVLDYTTNKVLPLAEFIKQLDLEAKKENLKSDDLAALEKANLLDKMDGVKPPQPAKVDLVHRIENSVKAGWSAWQGSGAGGVQ